MEPVQFEEGTIFEEFPFSEPKPRLVDVGANDGSWAIRLAERGWDVIALEPEPATFSLLQVKTAPYPNVTCVPRAASDSRGAMPLYSSAKHSGIHTLIPFHPTHEMYGEVQVIRLDEELASMGVNRVAALKVDAEGADLAVLKGFPFRTIRPELVMAEFMDSRTGEAWGYTHHDLVGHMKDFGFTSFVSEWEPIIEYGTADKPSSHRWLRIGRYDGREIPGWGNIIFVPEGREPAFEQASRIARTRQARAERRRVLAARLPWLKPVYRRVKAARLGR